MVTEEQARVAADRLDGDQGRQPGWRRRMIEIAADRDRLADWAIQELSRRTPPDDGPITAEEADRAYDEAESVPISDEEVEALLQHVRDRSDGPIGVSNISAGAAPSKNYPSACGAMLERHRRWSYFFLEPA